MRIPRDDTDDVAQNALERAVRSLRELPAPPDNVEAWLTTVTRRAIAGYWSARERRGEREAELGIWACTPTTVPDPADQVVSAIGTGQFIQAAANLLLPRDREALPLQFLVANNYMSRDTMAGILGIDPRNIHAADSRWRGRFTEALLVFAYLTDLRPDEQCDFLAVAVRRPLSPVLRKDVAKHIERCDRCAEHRAVLSKRVRRIAAAAPIVLPPPGLFEHALSAPGRVLPHKATLVGAVVAASACFIITGLLPNHPAGGADIVPSPATMIMSEPVQSMTGSVIGPVRSAVVAPPVVPTRHRAAPTAKPSIPTTAVPPTRRGNADPRGMTITVPANAVQYESIAATDGGCGRSVPTTSRISVVVTAPGGLMAVGMNLSGGDGSRNEAMAQTPGTSTWTGTVGPYRTAKHSDAVQVTVAAIGRDGTLRTARVGTVRIIICRSR